MLTAMPDPDEVLRPNWKVTAALVVCLLASAAAMFYYFEPLPKAPVGSLKLHAAQLGLWLSSCAILWRVRSMSKSTLPKFVFPMVCIAGAATLAVVVVDLVRLARA
jgi:hypothetical protein